ncbi:MBL fold metallo-hydrolase [Bacillus gobiensis]|uniref:MBL fold metallo-hydrolase n=1 Tax=Bacillus gobiensis TaxID=1441095 RepID=UPI003D1BB2EF
MKWTRIPLGPIQTNAYILEDDSGSALIVDPGAEAEKLISLIKEKNVKPLAILLTHAHFDHIGALDLVRKEWNLPVYLHEEEKDWLQNPSLNGSARLLGQGITAKQADVLIEKDQKVTIGSFQFDIFHTPGHSPGSVSYYFQDEGIVLSGDALFKQGIGRTDLTGGSYDTLLKSIHEQLLTLPEPTIVLSGHGPETDIQTEMDENPFLNGFSL